MFFKTITEFSSIKHHRQDIENISYLNESIRKFNFIVSIFLKLDINWINGKFRKGFKKREKEEKNEQGQPSTQRQVDSKDPNYVNFL